MTELAGLKLSRLKDERDALNAEIALIEQGIRQAAYDTCMAEQLIRINEVRESAGKPRLTMTQFCAGVVEESQ
jgi:hypothetical protein